MVLIHGAGPKGAERIAAGWADNRKNPQFAFQPEWTRHKYAPPFKRNDTMMEAMPIGVNRLPGIGDRREPRRQGPEDGNSGVAVHPSAGCLRTRLARNAPQLFRS